MLVPKGNKLIEDELLSSDDIEIMLNNLQEDQFAGYVKFDLGESSAFIFFSSGGISMAFEVNENTGVTTPQLVPRLLSRIKNTELLMSSYVVSPDIVAVLSGVFAFQTLFSDYPVKKRELNKVFENLEGGHYNGIIKLSSANSETVYLIVSQGELVTDRFCSGYGEMLCGADAVRERLAQVAEDGAVISVFAEKADEIENRRKQKEEELEKIKPLVAKIDGGFMRADDLVKVDEYLLREWGMGPKDEFSVEVEVPSGETYEYNCRGQRKFGNAAGLSKAMFKKMGINEGDVLNIRPL